MGFFKTRKDQILMIHKFKNTVAQHGVPCQNDRAISPATAMTSIYKIPHTANA